MYMISIYNHMRALNASNSVSSWNVRMVAIFMSYSMDVMTNVCTQHTTQRPVHIIVVQIQHTHSTHTVKHTVWHIKQPQQHTYNIVEKKKHHQILKTDRRENSQFNFKCIQCDVTSRRGGSVSHSLFLM